MPSERGVLQLWVSICRSVLYWSIEGNDTVYRAALCCSWHDFGTSSDTELHLDKVELCEVSLKDKITISRFILRKFLKSMHDALLIWLIFRRLYYCVFLLPHFIYSCILSSCGIQLFRDICPIDSDETGWTDIGKPIPCEELNNKLKDNKIGGNFNHTRIALLLCNALYIIKMLVAMSHYKLKFFKMKEHWLDMTTAGFAIWCFTLPEEWERCFLDDFDWSNCKSLFLLSHFLDSFHTYTS